MAFKKKEFIGVIDFISPQDEAINTDLDEQTGLPISDIEKYKEDWDFEKHCQIKEGEQPTKFKLNFNLTHQKQIMIDNASLGGDGKKEEFGFKLGRHKFSVVQSILVGIENPETLPINQRIIFKKDNRGLPHDDLMSDLYSYGIVEEIYSFYLKRKDDVDLLKKK